MRINGLVVSPVSIRRPGWRHRNSVIDTLIFPTARLINVDTPFQNGVMFRETINKICKPAGVRIRKDYIIVKELD